MYACPFIVFMYNYTCKYGKNNKCSKYKKEGRGKTFMYDKYKGKQIIDMFVRFNRIESTKVNN